jgi:rifampin ADP-ribosylating transferase
VARQQKTVAEKLKWDTTALEFALKIKEENVKGAYPSLYLNIGKCYEDLKDLEKALENYNLALSFTQYLQEDGYGKMIKAGVAQGIARVQ